MDFPGGTVEKNRPANAGNVGSIPDPGRFHMQWSYLVHELQLLKPMGLESVPINKRSHVNEKSLHHNEE